MKHEQIMETLIGGLRFEILHNKGGWVVLDLLKCITRCWKRVVKNGEFECYVTVEWPLIIKKQFSAAGKFYYLILKLGHFCIIKWEEKIKSGILSILSSILSFFLKPSILSELENKPRYFLNLYSNNEKTS